VQDRLFSFFQVKPVDSKIVCPAGSTFHGVNWRNVEAACQPPSRECVGRYVAHGVFEVVFLDFFLDSFNCNHQDNLLKSMPNGQEQYNTSERIS
jgi:hypothetical protein